jgi:hypothetical protein
MTMTDTQTQGGFIGDPAAALTVAGTGGCCGNPPQATLTLPDPDQASAAAEAPCCGTAAEATESGSCCGTSAKAEAVASGTGCCG